MKRLTHLALALLTVLVMVLSYLGGALAAPLRGPVALRPAAPTEAQWAALRTMNELLLEVDADVLLYLPQLIR
jgi:hypothetical protein